MNGDLAYKMLIAFIIRMNRNTSISKHSFRTCCCNLDRLIRASDLISKVNDDTKLDLLIVTRDIDQSTTGQLFIDDFEIRHGSIELGTPVYQPVRSINNTLFMQCDESLQNRRGAVFIHSESLASPVK